MADGIERMVQAGATAAYLEAVVPSRLLRPMLLRPLLLGGNRTLDPVSGPDLFQPKQDNIFPGTIVSAAGRLVACRNKWRDPVCIQECLF